MFSCRLEIEIEIMCLKTYLYKTYGAGFGAFVFAATRQEETTEGKDKRSQDKRRPKRQKPAQDKTRQVKGTHDKRRPEGRSLCSETALLPYTVPQTYKRSVGSTKAAAT